MVAPQEIRPLNTLASPGHAASGSLLDSDAYLQSQIPRRIPRRNVIFPATAPAQGVTMPPRMPQRHPPPIPKPMGHPLTPRNLLQSPLFEAARPLATDIAIGTDSMLAVNEGMAAVRASSFALQDSVGMWYGGANPSNRTLISTATDGLPVMTPYQSFIGYDIPSNPFATDFEGNEDMSGSHDSSAQAATVEAVADDALSLLDGDGLDFEDRGNGASSVEVTPERFYPPASLPPTRTLMETPPPSEQSAPSRPKQHNSVWRLGKLLKRAVVRKFRGS